MEVVELEGNRFYIGQDSPKEQLRRQKSLSAILERFAYDDIATNAWEQYQRKIRRQDKCIGLIQGFQYAPFASSKASIIELILAKYKGRTLVHTFQELNYPQDLMYYGRMGLEKRYGNFQMVKLQNQYKIG